MMDVRISVEFLVGIKLRYLMRNTSKHLVQTNAKTDSSGPEKTTSKANANAHERQRMIERSIETIMRVIIVTRLRSIGRSTRTKR